MGQIRQKGNYVCSGIEQAWGTLVQGGETIHKDNLEWDRATNATNKKLMSLTNSVQKNLYVVKWIIRDISGLNTRFYKLQN